MPEEAPYLEYVDGEVIEKAMPNRDHMLIVEELALRVGAYRRQRGGLSGPEGRVQFDLARRPAFRLPDYAYWSADKPQGGPRVMLPPTLAIEVRSPEESPAAQREKCRFYRAHGVEASWLVDPQARTVEVFEGADDGRLLADAEILRSEHLPGFELPLNELFGVLDR